MSTSQAPSPEELLSEVRALQLEAANLRDNRAGRDNPISENVATVLEEELKDQKDKAETTTKDLKEQIGEFLAEPRQTKGLPYPISCPSAPRWNSAPTQEH